MAELREGDRLARIQQERDLYLRILDLGGQTELEPFLEEALALIVEVTGARQGYLELRDVERDDSDADWWRSRGCSEVDLESIRSAISHGIIADAVATGRTIVTPSALLDPRFRERGSVQTNRIEAVLCAPIGADPPIGVVYLQGRPEPGPFSEDDRRAAEHFGRHIAPLSDRVLTRQRVADRSDATRTLRERFRVEEIVGRSEALAFALREASAAASLADVTVLLTGESGTGKTQLARAIHNNSPRASEPFIEVNVATFTDTLVGSELFGWTRGAFTGAHEANPGKVGAAERGTLFLDEISELSIDLQSKLLQFLQSREYAPIGSPRPVRANVRIIAATNQDLRDAVEAGRFRRDLYFRLEVVTIRMPSLAERSEDLPDLARSLCRSACERNRLGLVDLSPGAMLAIRTAEWPGNVRQLANAMERAVIRAASEHAARVERRHVFADAVGGPEVESHPTWQQATSAFQREFLRRALEEAKGNVSEVARKIDLARSYVYDLMKLHGIER